MLIKDYLYSAMRKRRNIQTNLKPASFLRMKTLIILLLIMLPSYTLSAQLTEDGLAFRRAQHLRRGINTSMWFAQSPGKYSMERLRSFTTEEDIALIHQLGFDHVRLSI